MRSFNNFADFITPMRRILWNTYAWPISVLILLGFLFELSVFNPLAALDVALSIPALIALHLHVWDVEFLSAAFWKPYAFAYIAWDLCYNLALNPLLIGGGGFRPVLLLLPLVALPLYVAVLSYAFRRWSVQPA